MLPIFRAADVLTSFPDILGAIRGVQMGEDVEAVVADNSEPNNKVWKSLLGLVNFGIFFTLLTLFRMRCQAEGASTVIYGDVTRVAKNVQVRGVRGVVTKAATDVTVRYGDESQAAKDVQIRGLGFDECFQSM